jgi:hypothetical protein
MALIEIRSCPPHRCLQMECVTCERSSLGSIIVMRSSLSLSCCHVAFGFCLDCVEPMSEAEKLRQVADLDKVDALRYALTCSCGWSAAVHLRKPLKDVVACADCSRPMHIQTQPISTRVLPHEIGDIYFWSPDASSKTTTSCAASAWLIPVNEHAPPAPRDSDSRSPARRRMLPAPPPGPRASSSSDEEFPPWTAPKPDLAVAPASAPLEVAVPEVVPAGCVPPTEPELDEKARTEAMRAQLLTALMRSLLKQHEHEHEHELAASAEAPADLRGPKIEPTEVAAAEAPADLHLDEKTSSRRREDFISTSQGRGREDFASTEDAPRRSVVSYPYCRSRNDPYGNGLVYEPEELEAAGRTVTEPTCDTRMATTRNGALSAVSPTKRSRMQEPESPMSPTRAGPLRMVARLGLSRTGAKATDTGDEPCDSKRVEGRRHGAAILQPASQQSHSASVRLL